MKSVLMRRFIKLIHPSVIVPCLNACAPLPLNFLDGFLGGQGEAEAAVTGESIEMFLLEGEGVRIGTR